MNFYYFESPHTQITEDFSGIVVDVHDGDTIKVKWAQREKPINVRMNGIGAPELDEEGGIESRNWLTSRLLNNTVDILIDEDNRVGKWGRIIGTVICQGMDVNQESIAFGFSMDYDEWLEEQSALKVGVLEI